MEIDEIEKFASFASLNRYFMLCEDFAATAEQAESAVKTLWKLYGASSEEQILGCGNNEIVDIYIQMKKKILNKIEK